MPPGLRPDPPVPPRGGENLPDPPPKRPPLTNLATGKPTEVNLPSAPARKPIEVRLPTPKPTKAGIVNLTRPKIRETTNPLPSQRLMSHLESKSPLMKQAATRGRQTAHRRGLLNSSLAAQASQEAVIGKGLEIAQADTKAALEGDRMNLQRQEQSDKFEIAGKQLEETGLRRITDEAIARDRLALDTEHYRTSTELQEQRIALDDMLGRGRLQLNTAEFVSREAIARDQLSLAIRQQLSNEDLAFYRANLEKVQLEHQIHVGVETLQLNRDKFQSDEAYRAADMELRKEIEKNNDTHRKLMASLEGERIDNTFKLGMADSAASIMQRQAQCQAAAAALGAASPEAGGKASENCKRTAHNALNMLGSTRGKELCDDEQRRIEVV